MLTLPNGDSLVFCGGALVHSGCFAMKPEAVRLQIEIANAPPQTRTSLPVDEIRVRRFRHMPSTYLSACDPATVKRLLSVEGDSKTPSK